MTKKPVRIEDVGDEYGVDPLHYIKTRIAVTKTEDEDRSKFIFRELVQNADDVESTSLIMRFEKDALYVANDGRAFTPEDFKSIKSILSRMKELSKKSTGNFGSGFVTVFALTNNPEVHSSDLSLIIDPVKRKCFEAKELKCREYQSPFDTSNSYVGVLFRFAWRTDEEAMREYSGSRPFADKSYWPRWNAKDRKGLYDDFKTYVHEVILCCQHLRRIVVIWADSKEGTSESYTAERNFTLDESFSKGVFRVTVGQCRFVDDFARSFAGSEWASKTRTEFPYFICKSKVMKNGRELRAIKKSGSEGRVVEIANRPLTNGMEEAKRNDVFLLLPLYDFDFRFPEKMDERRKRAYLYSTIPLPKRGKNKFSFSAHFFPTEDRKDVDVMAYDGAGGAWYRAIMESLASLYATCLNEFVACVLALSVEDNIKQRIIMNSLPGSPLHDWMKQEPERSEWTDVDKVVADAVMRCPAALFDGKWYQFAQAYVADSQLEFKTVRVLNGIAVGARDNETTCGDVTGHVHYEGYLKQLLTDRHFSDEKFAFEWRRVYEPYQDRLRYRTQPQKRAQTAGKEKDILLSRSEIETLQEYCLRDGARQMMKLLPIIPDRDGILRSKDDYRRFPEELQAFLPRIVLDSRLVHEDFKQVVTKLDSVSARTIAEYVDETYGRLTEKSIAKEFQDAASAILLWMFRDQHVALPMLEGLRVIPYEHEGRICLGPPNITECSDWEHLDEKFYQREWIFGFQPHQVIGLSSNVRLHIKMFAPSGNRIGDAEVKELERALSLLKLQARGDKPTTFVRQFVSPRHGSLFEDDKLAEFIRVEKNSPVIDKEKRILSEALPAYFDKPKTENHVTPSDMRDVPCLYDEDGRWFTAGSFAIQITSSLQYLGYRALHHDFAKWNTETLEALGVASQVSIDNVSRNVAQILKESPVTPESRTRLSDTLLYLLMNPESTKRGCAELKSMAWIPTLGGYVRPEESIWPSENNHQLLGNTFAALVDGSCASKALIEEFKTVSRTWSAEGQPNLQSRLENLCVCQCPTRDQMIAAIEMSMARSEAPPAKVFETLGEQVGDDELRGGHLGYYLDGKWYQPYEIVISPETRPIPQELRFVLGVAEKRHWKYLRSIGVDDRVKPDAVLGYMSKNPERITLELWAYLSEVSSEIDVTTQKRFDLAKVYPIEGRLVRPTSVFIFDIKGLSPLIVDEDHCIASEDSLGDYAKVLHELGASTEDGIGKTVVEDLLLGCFKKLAKAGLDSPQEELVLRLIKKSCEYNVRLDLFLPIRTSNTTKLMPAFECYFDDDYRAGFFADRLPILPRALTALRDCLEDRGVKSLKKSIKTTSGRRWVVKEQSEYTSLKERFVEVFAALASKYGHDSVEPSFGWLLRTRFVKVRAMEIKYSVGDVEAAESRQAHLGEREEGPEVSVVYPAGFTVFDELAGIIRSYAERLSTINKPATWWSDLEYTVSRLLRTDIEDWDKWIPGFKSAKSWVEPIEVVEIDDASYRRGYYETRTQLREWYKGCQVDDCAWQTPMSDDDYPEVCETVNSVISRAGGFASGDPGDYQSGNSLYLCPRHQRLMKRGLIKVPGFEALPDSRPERRKDKREYIGTLRKAEEILKGVNSSENEWEKLSCEVFESKNSDDFKYEKHELRFKREHLVGMMQWIREYVRKVVPDL